MTEVMVTTRAIRRAKLQSNHHHQQTRTHLSTGRMPFLSCTINNVRALKEKDITFHGLGCASSPLKVPGYLGGVLISLTSALSCHCPKTTHAEK